MPRCLRSRAASKTAAFAALVAPAGLGRRTRIGAVHMPRAASTRRPARDLACSVASEPVHTNKQRPTVHASSGWSVRTPRRSPRCGPHVSGLGAQCPPELLSRPWPGENRLPESCLPQSRAGAHRCHRGLLLRQLNSRSVGASSLRDVAKRPQNKRRPGSRQPGTPGGGRDATPRVVPEAGLRSRAALPGWPVALVSVAAHVVRADVGGSRGHRPVRHDRRRRLVPRFLSGWAVLRARRQRHSPAPRSRSQR